MDSPNVQLFLSTFVNHTLPLVDGVRVDRVDKNHIKLTLHKGPCQKVALVFLPGVSEYNEPILMAKEVASSMGAALSIEISRKV